MKIVILIMSILFTTGKSFAQNFYESEASVFTAEKIVFFGYDFSHFKLAEIKWMYDAAKNPVLNKTQILNLIENVNIPQTTINKYLPDLINPPKSKLIDLLDDEWIIKTIQEMRISSDPNVLEIGNYLFNNQDKITKLVSTINKESKEVILIKLDNFYGN